jgi:D-amino-acid dehydrogenase
MRIAVLGAGLAGITSAWECLRDGHDVIVLDRADTPADFTSKANAGLIAPGHAFAWASPRVPGIMLRSLWTRNQAIRFRPSFDVRQWRWLSQFLRQCTTNRARINTLRKARLCLYSQSRLQLVTTETAFPYDHNTGGLIYFYRSAQSFEAAAIKSEILADQGVRIESLDRDQVIARDPGLADARDIISGALFVPSDESGDARLFTHRLAQRCIERGAQLQMQTEITGLQTESGRVTAVTTSQGPVFADAFVLALGVFSPNLLHQLGDRIPIYPVKGYSVTLPSGADHCLPKLGGVDEDNLLAYCPMGNRLRITATAEIGNYNTAYTPDDFRTMLSKTQALMPRAADFSTPNYWAGLRPMTPTGLPLIGRSRWSNLWLNTGHGHMGWTMSCGSARILADLIINNQPEIPLEGIDPATMGMA